MKNLLCAFCFAVAITFSQAAEIDSLFQKEVIAFTDSLIASQIKNKIAGATLSVVKDGEIIHMNGYGKVDVENDINVNPECHLFRIGSISKMFVWTAIMQLVEQGKIKLDDDINEHMDLLIPEKYGQPVTVKHLMTHTPGFEDVVVGLFGRDSSTIRPLSEILKEQIPQRVVPPATAVSYSNHGTGMAQYIVERISGMDFNEYVETHILDPLEMTNTTFRQPVPKGLHKNLSGGFLYTDGQYISMDFEYVPMYGVGGCSSTAKDMANFMIAHLQLGTFNDQQVLDSATATLMQSPAFYNHPKVNPMRYGFMDVSQNGKTIIGHGGDTGWFHSFMAMYPEENLGFFISFNSQQGGLEYMKFVSVFTDRFFPEEVEQIQPALDSDALAEYAGFYTGNRYSHTSIAKMAKLVFSGNLTVTEEGQLKSSFLGTEQHWIPVDEEVFRERDSNELLVFTKNEHGKVANMFIDTLPVITFEKAFGIDKPMYHLIVLTLVIVLILFTTIFWSIKYFVRRSKANANIVGTLPRNAKRVSAWITLFWTLFLVTLISSIMTDPMAMAYEVPFMLKVSLLFPVLITILLILLAFNTITTWRKAEVKLINKLYLSTLFLVYAAGIWVLNYWNLLGFKY